MSVGLLLGMLLGSKYDPVMSWPHRRLPLFKLHNILGYVTLVLILVHPALLLFAAGRRAAVGLRPGKQGGRRHGAGNRGRPTRPAAAGRTRGG